MSKLLTGVAVGVLLGVLFAPDKGSSTRRKIADQGRDLKDRFSDFVDGLSSRFEEAEEEAEEFADKTKAAMR